MAIIPSPPYFINSSTNSSAPAAVLFLSLATYFFISSLVNYLCNPAEPLSSRSDACTFFSVHELISFLDSASKSLFVVGVPGYDALLQERFPPALRAADHFTVLCS